MAQRFNGVYGDVFTVPEPYIPKVGARIMSLQEPEKKMSKSDSNPNGFIAVLDSPDDILRKFKRAVTDSGSEVRRGPDKAGVNNLISIYGAVTGRTAEQTESEFAGKGYGDFKLAVAEAVIEHLRPIREKYEALMADKAYLDEVFESGAARAAQASRKTLAKVYRKVGFR